ncbi:hypothetical protein QVD17_36253 [Tagetes erecta]|uniref:F-box domain-containing protein n=1 Tax=Tagetes erecta TaxID=13708 RepID=A0AAD8JUF9_TARER|nr:hypothetical protein QVD17_36253 [Tagetes erecta]
MANVHHIGDDVICNILARLPGKPLLRFRCESKHWNRLISDPCFMKSRSRRMILSPYTRPLVVIDDNVPAEDEAHSIVRLTPYPLKLEEGTHVSVVGTLNGIVILALHDKSSLGCHLVLYSPLTRASKILEVMDPPISGRPYLNVKDLSKVKQFRGRQNCIGHVVGSLDGCLCLISNYADTINTFNVWMMKEEGVWLKACSFSFGSDHGRFYPLCILGDGKILMKGYHSDRLVIYNTSKDSYKTLKDLTTVDVSFQFHWWQGSYPGIYGDYHFRYSCPIHYVESLLSPSDIC